MKKYYVFGGQYEWYCYGGSDTLQEAKQLATKNMEYWDNWQGWHTPAIYLAENTKEIVCEGMITHRDGSTTRVPDGSPFMIRKDNRKWVEVEV